MLISLITAWICVFLAALTAFKFIARISGWNAMNRFFHKIHIPFGVLLLVFAFIHSVLAGNPSFATLSDCHFGSVLFTLNYGTAAFVTAILLGVTYLFRRKLKRKWMYLHRILTAIFIVLVVLHLFDMGLQLPKKIFCPDSTAATATQQSEAPTTMQIVEASDLSEPGSAQPQSETQSPTQPLVTFSVAVLSDGEYQGSADGYSGTITVSVTVSNLKVTNIEVVSQSDSEQFFSQATNVLDTIVSNQSLEVDAVSGATFSSAGLINAVHSALDQAVVSGTLKVNEIDLSQIKRHH